MKRVALLLAAAAFVPACSREETPPPAPAQALPKSVGYDLRVLRPREEEPLAAQFDRQVQAALSEGKRPAAYFSAAWCEACRRLDLELGNLHPPEAIGHIRIFKLVEEDWDRAMRLDEFNDLRTRFSPEILTYPLFVVLDEEGRAVENLRQAKDRLEAMGLEPTLALWLEDVGPPKRRPAGG